MEEREYTPEDLAWFRKMMAYPDIRPCNFDVTFAAWFLRISNWGKVVITYINAETREKREISQKEAIDAITDDNLLKQFGSFKIERTAINKCVFYRDFLGLDGKQYKEEFKAEVELSAYSVLLYHSFRFLITTYSAFKLPPIPELVTT